MPSRPRRLRGSVQPSRRRARSASSSGSWISSVTNWSPRLPSLRLKPLPGIRRVLPELEPGATVSITAPSAVGTLTLAPLSASSRLIGKSSRRLSPSRRKNGCGWVRIVTIASPAPPGPGSPLPASRIWVPSSTPAGSLRSMVLPSASVIRCVARAAASGSETPSW